MGKSIKEIGEELKRLPPEEIEDGIRRYAQDERAGVRRLVEAQEKRLKRYRAECARIETLCRYEKEYAAYYPICGIDEVGRGPLAGPVVAAAVILPKDSRILYINDSKKLSPAKREELSKIIREEAVSVGIGVVSHTVIDEINILNATYEAMRQAIGKLSAAPGILLNDAVTIPGVPVRQVPIIGGDGKSISIGAASIVAKVYRDHLMEEYDAVYPGYGFASNKGYGSKEHMEAIRRLGPCAIHRRTFLKNI